MFKWIETSSAALWFSQAAFVVLLSSVHVSCTSDEDAGYYTKPSLKEEKGFQVLRLVGTHYEMGRQFGRLMASKLKEGVEWVNNDPTFSLLLPVARGMGFIEEAMEQSYQEVLDECRGMVDAAKESGSPEWEMDLCIGLAYGEVIIENVEHQMGGGCTQAVAGGEATADGVLVHARNMDWGDLTFLLDNPVVIVRRPEGKIPSAVLGFPGSVVPYQGMNLAGLAVASNELTAKDDVDRKGRSHQQMMFKILEECSSLEEAEEFLKSQDHMTAEAMVISDGNTGEAAVFEMTANHIGIRRLSEENVLGMTNNFVNPEMKDLGVEETEEDDSWVRYERLMQLIEPDGEASMYGDFDLAHMASVLRDNYDPRSGEECPKDTFDGCRTIANSATIYSLIFVPSKRTMYIAEKGKPVPMQRFVGFTMEELLRDDGSGKPPSPPYIP